MPDPIRQDIDVNYDGQPVEDAARDQRELGAATEESAQAADGATEAERRRERQLAEMRAELQRTIREQLRAEKATEDSERDTVDAALAEANRADRIAELSRALAKVEDEERAVQSALDESIAKHRQSAQAVDDGLRPQQDHVDLLGLTVGKLGGVAAGFAGAGGVIEVYQQWIRNLQTSNEYLRENQELFRSATEARLDFVALRGVEDAETVARIDNIASVAGRRPGEVYRGAALLQSQFPQFEDAQVDQLLTETAGVARLTTAPFNNLANGIATIVQAQLTARETPNFQGAANLFLSAVDQAGEADPGRLSETISQFAGIGVTAGLPVDTSVGLASAVTGIGLPREIATTGLKNVVLSLAGKGTAAGQALFEELGIATSDPLDALRQLAAARGRGDVDLADLEGIAGREGLPVLAALSDPSTLDTFFGKVGAVEAADDRPTRLSDERAGQLFEPGSAQGLALFARQEDAAAESIRANSPRAQAAAASTALLNRLLAERVEREEISPAFAERIRNEFAFQLGYGRSPEEAIDIAEDVPFAAADESIFVFREPFTGQLIGPRPQQAQRGAADFISEEFRERFGAGAVIELGDTTIERLTAGIAAQVPSNQPGPSYLTDNPASSSFDPEGG
ncbi:MAG: phage tail tape measure protein [Planctomycetota bacterium]